MANVINIQTLVDGNENTIISVDLDLDTSDVAYMTLADPAILSDIGPFAGRKATQLRFKKAVFNVEDGITVEMFWDATTPVEFEALVGRGNRDYKDFGGLQNNAGAGKTGKISFKTQGFAAGGLLQTHFIVYLGKQV